MELLTLKEINGADKIKDSLTQSELREYVYSKGYYNIEFFSDFFLFHWKQKDEEYIKTPAFHKEIWKKLDDNKNLNVIIPRGHGKTTSILIWIMHALLYEKYKNILYIASSGLGEEGIGKIKQELEENTYLKEIFGLLTPQDFSNKKEKRGKKWRQKELELLNGVKVQTISKGQSIRGKRPSKIIVDDPQENHEVESKTITQKFNAWFFTSLYNTLLPGSSICTLGTIVGNLCLVKHLRDEKGWDTLEFKAIERGKALWEGLWSLKALQERKKILGSAYFNQEFMNIPLSKENTIVKEEWLRYYANQKQSYENVVMAIDPATTEKEKSDYTGITVMGNIGVRKYVIYSKQIKLSPSKLEIFIKELYKIHSPSRIYQETNIELKLFEDLRRAGLPIIGIKAHRDKYTRLLEVTPALEFGEVFFRTLKDDELCYQLTNFPDVEHDDILDSFVYALKGLLQNSDENGGNVLIIN